MSKKKLQPGQQRIDFRPGVNKFPGFAGMDRQSDPGAIALNRFYHLQNVRIRDGEVVARGGLLKVNPDDEAGCIVGIFDNLEDLEVGQSGLFFTDNSVAGTTVRVGKFIDDTYTDHFTGDPNAGASASVFCSFNSNPFIIVGTKGYVVESGGTLTETFTLADNAQYAIEHDGDLYIITDSNSTLVKWDGASLTTETDSIDFIGALYSFDGDLYVGGAGDANGNDPYIRSKSGSYAELTWPGAITAAIPTANGVTFGSKHYTGWADTTLPETGNNLIISIQGSTVAVEREPSAHDYTAAKGVRGLAVQGSTLLFVHNTSGSIVLVGSYDGGSWTDSAKNLTTQADIGTTAANGIAVNDGFIYVSEEACDEASPAREPNLIRCATVGGTWAADVVPAGKFEEGIGTDSTTNPYPIVGLA